MRVLHLLAGGNVGGIEVLLKNYVQYSAHENHFTIIWGRNGSVTELLKKQNCKVTELHTKGKINLHNFQLIEKYCRKNKIDAVVAHHSAPLAHLYLMYIKYKLPEILTVAYAHCNAVDMCRMDKKRGLKLRWAVLSRSLKQADVTVAISKSVADSLIHVFQTPSERIQIIYNGTDLHANQNMVHTAAQSTVRLIYVGRLIEQKGVQLTLQALSQLKSEHSWCFDIVGDGAYRQTLEKLCRELDLEQHVTFLGERLDVPQMLANSDIFVHMPFGEEGFGITIIEAMAAGLVCVCGAVGAIPEIITDGKNGYLVPKHDVNALAEKLTEVIESIRLSGEKEVRLRARSRAEDFAIEKFARELDGSISSGCANL